MAGTLDDAIQEFLEAFERPARETNFATCGRESLERMACSIGYRTAAGEPGACSPRLTVNIGSNGVSFNGGRRLRLYRKGTTYVYTVAPGFLRRLWARLWGRTAGWRHVRSRHAPGTPGAPDGVPLATCARES